MHKYVLRKRVSPTILAEAKKVPMKASMKKRSITDGDGLLAGTVGELQCMEMYHHIYKHEPVHANTVDYDIVLKSSEKETVRLDVKTKNRNYPPCTNWAASVARYSLPVQDCQVYAFTQVVVNEREEPDVFYYLGHIMKQRYVDESVLKYKGDRDGNNVKKNGKPFTISEDCWNLDYSELSFFDEEIVEMLLEIGYEKFFWKTDPKR